MLRPTSPSDNPQSITVATSSGLGNSITSSWEPDNLVETILSYHRQQEEPELEAPFSSYLASSYSRGSVVGSMGESIDLFREKDETASDSDFDADDFDS